jgi:hypothetical protein
MRVTVDTGDRLVLSGPPGGSGAVILLLVVGAAMSAGGGLFLRVGQTNGATPLMIMGGLAGAVGLALLLAGVGVMLTRDRLELDRVTGRGSWTRRLCGRPIGTAIAFDIERARHVRVEHFTESLPRTGDGGGGTSEKVRASLLISKPRRRIVLDEAERQRAPRVREVAQSVAELLGLEVEEPTSDD